MRRRNTGGLHQQPSDRPGKTDRSLFKDALREVQLLCQLVHINTLRTQHEHSLISHGTEPRFFISWRKLLKLVRHPDTSALRALIERLEQLAASESDEAVEAFQQYANVPHDTDPPANAA